MPSLAFILGREPHLSVAELYAVLGDSVDWSRAELSPEVLVVEHEQSMANSTSLMRRCAGIIKIAEGWESILGTPSFSTDAIAHCILDHTAADRRVRFGYSVYDCGGGVREVERIRRALARGARAQKEWLEERGRKVRHVTSRAPSLSSVTVERQGLLPEDNGVEVCVLVGHNRVRLARTLAVQPYQEWSARDYGRPRRDARSGMLPPKLARIMVNLVVRGTPDERHHALLDPFCGSGTVLMEALLLGVPRVIGTDASADAVRDAQENIAWVQQAARELHTANPKFHMIQCDVRALSRCVRERVHSIATEPHLGAPGVRTAAQRASETEKLRALYRAAFQEFATVLIPGGRVVFIVPDVRSPSTVHRPAFASIVTADAAAVGFRRVPPFPPALRDHPILRGKDDLPYAREDQRMGRRTLVFQFNGHV